MFLNIYETALNGSIEDQHKCFGTSNTNLSNSQYFLSNFIFFFSVFPSECSTVYPPVSIECMNTIWLNSSCVSNGTHYPASLVDTSEIDSLNVL